MANLVANYVQERILSALDRGIIPWHKPWTGGGHRNLISRHVYRGINPWLLHSEEAAKGYKSQWWATLNQISSKGWHLRQGSKAAMVVFWRPIKVVTKDKSGNDKEQTFPMLRYFNVFNSDCIEGAVIPKETSREHQPIVEAEDLVTRYSGNKGPTIEAIKSSDRACYSPTSDRISMPSPEQFKGGEEYYSALFHECVHSTGHKSRLDRFSDNDKEWGLNDSYSFEELIAESGACMLNCHVGIDNDKIFTNSVAYIQAWRNRIAKDKNLIIRAAGRAQKAVDLIVGVTAPETE